MYKVFYWVLFLLFTVLVLSPYVSSIFDFNIPSILGISEIKRQLITVVGMVLFVCALSFERKKKSETEKKNETDREK